METFHGQPLPGPLSRLLQPSPAGPPLHLCPGSPVLSRPPKITRPHSLTAQTSLVMPMRLNVPPSWAEWAFLCTHEIVMAETLVAFNPLLFKNILGRGESSTSFPPEKHTNTEH